MSDYYYFMGTKLLSILLIVTDYRVIKQTTVLDPVSSKKRKEYGVHNNTKLVTPNC